MKQLLSLFFFLTLFCNLCLAVDRHVPGQYSTIQAAINASNDGDTVLVSAGTYHEAINLLGKAITLRGSITAPETRVIDGTGLNTTVILCRNSEWTDTVIEGFTVRGGVGYNDGGYTYGGGLFARFASPTIRHCVFRDNIADAGGGVALLGSSSQVRDCVFQNNEATTGGYFGGGGLFASMSNAKIFHCRFEGNLASVLAKGGGISLFLGSPEISNCLIVNNVARHGGGIMNQKSTLKLTNVTIAGNQATGFGGGFNAFYPSALSTLNNVIVWGNTAGTSGNEILDQSGAITTIRHGLINGGWNGAGEQIIDLNPQFLGGQTGNFRLSSTSPAVDFGNAAYLPTYISADLDGNPRIVGTTIDLGPYENQDPVIDPPCAGDIDHNGQIGQEDLILLLSQWGSCAGCEADLLPDGNINFYDLMMLLSLWGSCP